VGPHNQRGEGLRGTFWEPSVVIHRRNDVEGKEIKLGIKNRVEISNSHRDDRGKKRKNG